MKTILICPNQASGLSVLADLKAPPTLPVLGEAFICHWMHHLAAQKFKEVRIVTWDPVELIEEYTSDGSRWGIRVEIYHEVRDLQAEEVRQRYKSGTEGDWAPEPHDVIEADHLPGLPEQKLFTSYGDWFRAVSAFVPVVGRSRRVGVREVAPGVWAGRRCKIAKSARLVGPAWIGDHVQVGKNCVIGPNSFIENQCVIESGSMLEQCWMGPETFLGTLTELKDSLAWGNQLINWKTGWHTTVPDPFLLTSLSETRPEEKPAVRRTPVEAQSAFGRRIEDVISLAQKLQG